MKNLTSVPSRQPIRARAMFVATAALFFVGVVFMATSYIVSAAYEHLGLVAPFALFGVGGIIWIVSAIALVISLLYWWGSGGSELMPEGRKGPVLGAIIISGLLVLVPFLALAVPSPDGTWGEPPPPAFTPDLYVLAASDHTDGASYPNGIFSSDCDTLMTAGSTPEWQSTEVTRDLTVEPVVLTADITVDTSIDLDTGSTGMDPNCYLISHTVRLENGQDFDGDGNIDAVQYAAKVLSISRTTFADNASTALDLIYQQSSTGIWYIGFYTEGASLAGTAKEAYSDQRVAQDLTGGAGNQVVLGNDNGGSGDTVYFFFIVDEHGFGNYDSVKHDKVTIRYLIFPIGYESAGTEVNLVLDASTVS